MTGVGEVPAERGGWCESDARSMTTWLEIGYIPDDASTQWCALQMLFRLWAKHQEVLVTMGELVDAIGEKHAAAIPTAAVEMPRLFEVRS